MKNLNEIAARSAAGTKIYYSVIESAVYTEDGPGRWFVTELIRKNEAQEIEKAVRRWLAL